MEGSIIFYTYGSTLELNGQQFEAGRLTEDLLNLSPDDYHPLHERMVRIRTLMDIYEYVRKSELWWKLNDEMEQLCQELRRYTVFRLLPDDCYDAFFSVIREITGQFSLFPPEEHSLSEDDQTKLLSASAEEFFQSDDGDSDPEISLGLLDLFRRREGSEEKGELFYYEMFRLLGACEDTWSAYKKYIDRYMMYLHDIRAFVPTIRNFIKFILSTLTTNGPESYAAALYGFYNDDRTAEKLIVNPITYHGDCYRRHDEYMLSYVPRELPDGSMAICQEHVTDSLQALMKADYFLWGAGDPPDRVGGGGMRTVSIPREQIFQGPLVLVNRAHPLHEKERSALTSVDPHHPDILLESRARQLLSACIQKAGGQREIVPVSGWRSQQEQQRIWDDSMAEHGETFTRQYVALPGCSEHQTGLAIDLGKAAGYIDFIRPAFPYDGVCGRFRRLAARYGFIERYQRGKEEVTGISAEPWHFRYVGAPHAQLMETNGLCLEEYRDFLRQGPRSVALENGRMAQVFYVPAAGAVTEVEVPEGCCQISGDNVEGFILTWWGDTHENG